VKKYRGRWEETSGRGIGEEREGGGAR